MKKLIAAIFAAVLMAAGLVTVSGGAATAACPYTGCVATDSDVSGPNILKRGNKPRLTITVDTNGNADPRGTVRLIIKRDNGGFFFTRNVYYSGETKTIIGPDLNKLGRHTVTIRFIPRDGSPYKRSSDSKIIRVHRPA